MIKRACAAIFALVLCMPLGSCTSFSGVVSDAWPTWLGGMPKDVPPRPGAPGYEEFLAQQQGKAAPAAVPAANGNTQPAAPVAPAAGAQPPPFANPPPSDQGVVHGGLY
jgi:hypothetical protein